MDPLQRYLQEQRDSGQVESSGGFTLAWQQAREKLRQFMLPSAAHYGLKLVQVAVAAGAEEVHFVLTRRETVCHFTIPDREGALELDDVDRILSQGGGQPTAEHHLAVAINGALMEEAGEVTWGVWSAAGGRAVSIREGGIEEFADAPLPLEQEVTWGQRFCHFRRVRASASFLSRASASEHALLATRCGYAPIPVNVDGRAVGTPVPPLQAAEWHKKLSQCYFLARLLAGAGDGPLGISIDPPITRDKHKDWRRMKAPTLAKLKTRPLLLSFRPDVAVERETRRVRGHSAISVPLSLAGVTNIHPVLHGVTLEPIPLVGSYCGAAIALSGEGLQTDLTGFSVVQNKQAEQLRQQAGELLRQITQDLQTVHSLPPYPDQMVERSAKLACCCVLGWLSIFLLAHEWYRKKQIEEQYPGQLAEAMRRTACQVKTSFPPKL